MAGGLLANYAPGIDPNTGQPFDPSTGMAGADFFSDYRNALANEAAKVAGNAQASPFGGIAGALGVNSEAPNDWRLTRADLESPLAYTQPGWQPNDSGGYFTLDQIGNHLAAQRGGVAGASALGDIYQRGSNMPSTNNWRLTVPYGGGPGDIMRNGQVIHVGPESGNGLPFGYDLSYSDTAESGAPGLQRRVNPGAALAGVNKWDAFYWPGGSVMGRSRWPYRTDV